MYGLPSSILSARRWFLAGILSLLMVFGWSLTSLAVPSGYISGATSFPASQWNGRGRREGKSPWFKGQNRGAGVRSVQAGGTGLDPFAACSGWGMFVPSVSAVPSYPSLPGRVFPDFVSLLIFLTLPNFVPNIYSRLMTFVFFLVYDCVGNLFFFCLFTVVFFCQVMITSIYTFF